MTNLKTVAAASGLFVFLLVGVGHAQICGRQACETAKDHLQLADKWDRCHAHIGSQLNSDGSIDKETVWITYTYEKDASSYHTVGIDPQDGTYSSEEPDSHFEECPKYPTCPSPPPGCADADDEP